MITQDNVTVELPDGVLREASVSPKFTVEWAHFNEDVHDLSFEMTPSLKNRSDDGVAEPYSATYAVDQPATSGAMTVEKSAVQIYDKSIDGGAAPDSQEYRFVIDYEVAAIGSDGSRIDDGFVKNGSEEFVVTVEASPEGTLVGNWNASFE